VRSEYFRCCDDFFICGFGPAELQILLHCPAEKEVILCDDADLFVQRLERDVLEVNSVNGDCTVLRFIETR